jgi:CheY-like chemotaxis protein
MRAVHDTDPRSDRTTTGVGLDAILAGGLLGLDLDMWGMEPVVTTTASEALDLIAERRPDLVITDFMMPGMNGHELCRRVRADSRLKAIPLVLMSAATGAAQRASPADAFVAKPIQIDEVETVLRHWLGRKAIERGGTQGRRHRPTSRH